MYMLKSSWWCLLCWIDVLTKTKPGIRCSLFVLLRYDAVCCDIGLQTHCIIVLCEEWILSRNCCNGLAEIHTTSHLYRNCEQHTLRAGFNRRGCKGKQHQSYRILWLVFILGLFSASPGGSHQAKVSLLHCHFGISSPVNADLIWTPVFVRYRLYPSGHTQAAPFPAACSELVKPRTALVRKS